MPINPYANQMQTMQTQGIPVQNFGGAGPATSGPTTLPAPATPVPGVPGPVEAGRDKIARAAMNNRPFLDAWRQEKQNWLAQRPVQQPNMPIDRAAFDAWRASRPQRPMDPRVGTGGGGNDRMRPAAPPVI